MSDFREAAAESQRTEWVKPELKRLEAGSAESNGVGINDNGPVGNARS